MPTPKLLPDPKLARLERVVPGTSTITVVMTTTRDRVACPGCGHLTDRVHSRYARTLADLPWNGHQVRLRLHTRRFFCSDRQCAVRVFTERLPGLAERYARRTIRLTNLLQLIGFAVGGEAGSRIAAGLGLTASPDSLLRRIRAAAAETPSATRVLGVDDWAFRKGRRYGTLLVNMETSRPIDLLPDRRAETLAQWLRAHPGIEIITRDRDSSYAEGARAGAPDALQVADRFHLLRNAADALEAVLARHQQALAQSAAAHPPADEPVQAPSGEGPEAGQGEPSSSAAAPTRGERDSAARRERRYARYDKVLDLHQQGHSIRAIAKLTGLCRHTVRKYVVADSFPEIKKRAARATQVTPYRKYLRQRWNEGCHNAAQLCREIAEQGFAGEVKAVRTVLSAWRARLPPEQRRASGPKPRRPSRHWIPSPRSVAWWMLGDQEKAEAEHRQFVGRLEEACTTVKAAHALVAEFFGMVRQREAAALDGWCRRAAESNIPELKSLSVSLRRDWSAVVAALTLDWSNGAVEGHVNRLKLLKRQMYGRGSFDLLRARVLHAA
jgi:transposase